MSIVPFLAVCAAGALAAFLARPFARVGRGIAIAGVATAFVAALAIAPDDRLTVGGVELATSWYGGLFLSTLAAGALALCLLGLTTEWPETLAPAALTTFGALGVAFTATQPDVALAAAAASATPVLVVAARAGRTAPEDVGRAELRTLALLAAGASLAALSAMRPGWAGGDAAPALTIAYLALVGALAVRFGAVPFHVPATRLGAAAPSLALPLALVWAPAGLAAVALGWAGGPFGLSGGALAVGGAVVLVLGLATLLLGPIGALLHDRLEDVVIYSIAADAGIVLMALSARSPDVAEPARLWLLTFVVAKTALVAWLAAMAAAFRTTRLDELGGWLRRAPLLGAALLATGIASVGWPGAAVAVARSRVVEGAVGGPLLIVAILAALLTIAYYGRLFLVGLLPATSQVLAGRGERPSLAPEPSATGATKRTGERVTDRATLIGRRAIALARRSLATLRLNRGLEVGVYVLAAGLVALAIGAGRLGAADAASSGVAIERTPSAVPLLPGAAEPTLEPSASPSPEASASGG